MEISKPKDIRILMYLNLIVFFIVNSKLSVNFYMRNSILRLVKKNRLEETPF